MFHNSRIRLLPLNLSSTLVIIAAGLVDGASARAANVPELSATVINGVSAYSPMQLFAVYRDQLGRPISSASAQAIIAQIEALYARDGYSRPEFRLDSDLTANGILRIEVFEAQVAQVIVGGDAGPYAARLDVIANELRSHVPVRSADLQAALQTMRDLPGLTINATTRRDESRPNSYALLLDASFKPVEGVVQVTNRGTDEIGPQFALGQLVANNFFGLGERIGLLYSGAFQYDEYHGVGLFADLPVDSHDTHFTASTFASHSDPTETPDRNDIYDRARTTLRVTRPIDAGPKYKVALSAGIDFDDLQLKRDGEQLREEKLRVAELGGRLIGSTSPMNQYLLSLQVRKGLNGFGSTLDAADLTYDPRRKDFWLTRVQFTHLTRFATNWTVRVDALGQSSAYVLPDAERYKIGGERLGRGFEVTAIAGDQGVGAKAELRRDLSSALSAFGKTSVYGFYDFGAVWKQDLPGRESAATSGFGLSCEYGRVSGFIEIAKPMTHADLEGNRDPKIFVELSLKL